MIRLDAFRIQLATSRCKANGPSDHGSDCITGGDGSVGNPFVYTAREVITLTADKNAGRQTIHSLVRTAERALPGLVDGRSYVVRSAGTSSFQLQDDNGNPVTFSNSGRTGGSHTFTVEGINLTSVGSGLQSLVLNLTGGPSGAKFGGVGGAAAVNGAPSGDNQVTASTSGVGGGFIDVGASNANATETVTTNITIAGGADLRGGTIVVKTAPYLDAKATADGKGGGFVSLGDASSSVTGTNNSTVSVADNAVLTATGDLTVRSFTDSIANARATTGNGGLGAAAESQATATLEPPHQDDYRRRPDCWRNP